MRNEIAEDPVVLVSPGMAVLGPGTEPLPARVQLLRDSLLVEPIDSTITNPGASAHWPLSAIQTVDEVGLSPSGASTLEIQFANGVELSISPPADFTIQLLARLQGASRRSETASLEPAVVAAEVPPPYLGGPPVFDRRTNKSSPAATTSLLAPSTQVTAGPSATEIWSAGAGPGGGVGAGGQEVATPKSRRLLIAVVIGVLFASSAATAVAAMQAHARATDAEELAQQRAGELRSTRTILDETREKFEATATELEAVELRVSELTNEKAAVQDERNAAQELSRLGADAAGRMLDCRDRILDAMSYMVDDFYIAANAALDSAVPVCQAANSAVAAFSDAVQ